MKNLVIERLKIVIFIFVPAIFTESYHMFIYTYASLIFSKMMELHW